MKLLYYFEYLCFISYNFQLSSSACETLKCVMGIFENLAVQQ